MHAPNFHGHPLLCQPTPFTDVPTLNEFHGNREPVCKTHSTVNNTKAALAKLAFDSVETLEFGKTAA